MNFIKKIVFLLDNKIYSIFYIVALLTFSSFFEVFGIGMIASFVNFGIQGEDVILDKLYEFFLFFKIDNIDKIYFLGLLFIIIFFLKTLFVIGTSYKIEHFSRKVEFDLKQKLLDSFVFLPDHLYSKESISNKLELITRLTQTFQGPCLVSILKLLSNLILLSAIITLLLITEYKITLISFFIIVFISFIYTAFLKPVARRFAIRESIATKNLFQSIYEIIDGISELKIYKKTNFFINRFANSSIEVFKNSLKSSILFFVIKPTLELIIVIFFVSFILFLKLKLINFEEYIYIFSIFIIALLRLLPLTTEVISSLNRLLSSEYAVDRIYNEVIKPYLKTNLADKNKFSNFNFECIELLNVDFAYERDKNIIQNLNLKIKKNDFVGISGNSGCGKTTLVNIIMGKFLPNKGMVKINDNNIEDFLTEFQKKIAYIQQQPFIFEGTLSENICLESNINHEKFILSLKNSELYDFYIQDPKKTYGDKGSNLSGGQKQRISIARALYHDREILILDEFTNQLDTKTEQNIMSYLQKIKSNKTIILISHNKTILKYCDQIINL